jgi:hypothetical protein
MRPPRRVTATPGKCGGGAAFRHTLETPSRDRRVSALVLSPERRPTPMRHYWRKARYWLYPETTRLLMRPASFWLASVLEISLSRVVTPSFA